MRIGGCAIAVTLMSGCLALGGDHPYDDLSDRQRSYLMPDAATWSPGDPCDGDCPGAIPLNVLREAIWYDVLVVSRPGTGLPISSNVVQFTIDDGSGDRTLDLPMSIDDPERIAAAAGVFDLVLARPRDPGWMSGIPIAIDEEGRLAFVGRHVGAVAAPTITAFAVDLGAASGADAIDALRDG